MARVLSEVYGDRMASSSGKDGESFPLQQKLLVCCLLLVIRNGKSKEVQLGKVSLLFKKVEFCPLVYTPILNPVFFFSVAV